MTQGEGRPSLRDMGRTDLLAGDRNGHSESFSLVSRRIRAGPLPPPRCLIASVGVGAVDSLIPIKNASATVIAGLLVFGQKTPAFCRESG